jgi:hypothetical protein
MKFVFEKAAFGLDDKARRGIENYAFQEGRKLPLL